MNATGYEGQVLETLAKATNYYAWIFKSVAPWVRGNVIEYGAGLGTASERLVTLADRLTLVEPTVQLANVLCSRFANDPRVAIAAETIETHAPRIAANTVDCVVLINVLEHIEDDSEAMVLIFRMLKPGGRLIVFVPAGEFLMSKMDLVLGHFRRYDTNDLMSKITGAGGEMLLCRYFDMAGVVTWWVVNTLMGATTLYPTLLRINDKVVVPISRAFERIVPIPIGKNLISIAEKPGLKA